MNNRVGSSPTPGTIIKILFGQQVSVASAALEALKLRLRHSHDA